MLFDTHVHLNDEYFADKIDEVIEAAHLAGVAYMLIVGYDAKSNGKAIELASRYPNIYAAVGFHPNYVLDLSDQDYEALELQLSHDKVVALGEIGLDFHWDVASEQQQMSAFIRQIEMAKRHDLCVIIHSRDAMEKTYNVLKQHPIKAVMHCFSGSLEMARQFIDLGIFVSLAGPVTFKNAKALKLVAKDVDLDYLLVETDCPYLTPEPHRGKRNQPAYVSHVVQQIADLREVSYDTIAQKTTNNALKLFKIVG